MSTFSERKKITENFQEMSDRKTHATTIFLEAASKMKTASAPTAPPTVPGGPLVAQCKPIDALKPEKLSKESSPVEFKLWCQKFRAFYQASNFQVLAVETQQEYVYALIDQYLHQYLKSKVANDTPIFGDTDSVMAYLKDEFEQLYTTFTRRYDFFKLHHFPKQNFSEFLVKLKAMSVEADLGALTPDRLLVFRALTACSNKQLSDLRIIKDSR